MNAKVIRAVALLVLAWSCAGDGTGLDEFGNPLGNGSGMAATLSSIQHNIFTPICTRCHTGAAAPLGLALDSAVAYQDLVGVPSSEIPSLLLVTPEIPDSSYLLWKIEGRSGIVGGRMPLGLPRLSDEQIVIVREWIVGGAQSN